MEVAWFIAEKALGLALAPNLAGIFQRLTTGQPSIPPRIDHVGYLAMRAARVRTHPE